MKQWMDCQFFEECIGCCERCKEDGNPYYDPKVCKNDEPTTSDLIHDILIDFFVQRKQIIINNASYERISKHEKRAKTNYFQKFTQIYYN